MRAEDKYKNKKANRLNEEKAKLKAEQNRVVKTKEITEQEKLERKVCGVIKTIFPHFESFWMDDNSLYFSVENCEITFDQLQKLSIVFNTILINLSDSEKVCDGCPTCGWGEKYLRPIYVGKIDFDKLKEN